ncbi:hypothetical protein MTR67_013712 [Solanum verrucosum]|uniref:Uncharacterized protein n=1 Tax=Solanum verrucosum TaxID=315347 RepID=A0AAF0QCE8_SOLVR|nr:hypothetical protein MTR67_013712 [Solanum verrucosum]
MSTQVHLSGDMASVIRLLFTCICDEFTGEDGEITVTHIALGIWSVKESAGHIIMSTLGFDDEKAKELAKFMDKDIELTYK